MGLRQPSSHAALPPQGHPTAHRCPVCEQPIGQDIVRRIEARQREQHETTLRRARAEAAAAVEQDLAAARNESRQAAAALGARLAEFQAKLVQEQEVRRAVEAQMAALKAEQQAVVDARVAEIRDGLERLKADLQREKESAVLAEKA